MALVALLHEASGWIAVDKPSGVVVIPGRGEDPAASLWRTLERERGEPLWVVHRIDRATSGIVVFARTAEHHRNWSIAFEQGRVEKGYLAFTSGVPRPGEIRAPLVSGDRGRMRIAGPGERGKPATTRVTLVRVWPGHALVRVQPLTGRQHQIRVHLAHAGAPILADPLYGDPEGPTTLLDRLGLHAERLVAPPTCGGVEITAPLPADFAALLQALERGGGGGRSAGS